MLLLNHKLHDHLDRFLSKHNSRYWKGPIEAQHHDSGNFQDFSISQDDFLRRKSVTFSGENTLRSSEAQEIHDSTVTEDITKADKRKPVPIRDTSRRAERTPNIVDSNFQMHGDPEVTPEHATSIPLHNSFTLDQVGGDLNTAFDGVNPAYTPRFTKNPRKRKETSTSGTGTRSFVPYIPLGLEGLGKSIQIPRHAKPVFQSGNRYSHHRYWVVQPKLQVLERRLRSIVTSGKNGPDKPHGKFEDIQHTPASHGDKRRAYLMGILFSQSRGHRPILQLDI